MGWFDWFRRRRRPPPPPAAPSLHAVGVSAFNDHGEPVVGAAVSLAVGATQFAGVTDGAGYCGWPEVPVSLVEATMTIRATGHDDYTAVVALSSLPQILRAGVHAGPVPPNDISLPPVIKQKPVHPHRSGVVVGNGHHFQDMGGVFFPLGATLFWALRGWKFERARVQQNIGWLADRGFDYIRILGEVSWAGNEIDPRWPDYQALLGELIDWSYDRGIRVQPTIFGSGTLGDPAQTVRKVASVIHGREQKILFVEVANEWYQNFKNEALLMDLGKTLRKQIPCLVALSAPSEEQAIKRAAPWIAAGAANMATAHFDRADTASDWKWRHVRKPWEPRNPGVPSSHNEPGGPHSSVASYDETIHLVTSRLTGILCGVEGYVLHNGNGVAGRIDPSRNRQPDVWSLPRDPAGLDAAQMYDAVRRVDALLSIDATHGAMTRTGLTDGGIPHPMDVDAFMTSSDHGVVRDYARTNGDRFWQLLTGIKGRVVLKPSANFALELVNPITGAVRQRTVRKGEAVELRAIDTAQDSRGLGAYLVRGRRWT